MRLIKLIFKAVGVVAALVTMVFLLFLAVVLLFPQALVTPWTLKLAEAQLSEIGIGVSYDSFELEISSESLTRKKVQLKSQNFCLNYQKALETCQELVFFEAKLNLIGRPVLLSQLGPVTLENGTTTVDMAKLPSSGDDEPTDYRAYIRMMRHTNIGTISAKNQGITYIDDQGKASKALLTIESDTTNPAELSFVAAVAGQKGFPFKSVKFKSTINLDDSQNVTKSDIELAGVSLGGDTLNLVGQLAREGASFRVAANAKVRQSKTKIELNVRGNADPQNFTGTVSADLNNLTAGIAALNVSGCRVKLHADDEYDHLNLALTACGVALQRNAFDGEDDIPVEFPKKIESTITSSIHLNLTNGLKSENSRGRLELTPLRDGLYQVEGGLNFKLDGSITAKNKPNLEIELDTRLMVEKFENLVQHLQNSSFSIPAPFNSLSGRAECSIDGTINLGGSDISIPHRCSTAFTGDRQSFITKENGTFHLKFVDDGLIPRLDATVLLTDIELFLPAFELNEPLPVMTTDDRFTKREISDAVPEPVKKDKGDTFSYRLVVKTEEKPIRIQIPSHNTHIPLYLDLVLLSHGAPKGTVSVRDMSVKVINKTIEIEHVLLDLVPPDPSTISAKARIKKSDFDVIVNVSGLTEKPQIELTSDPIRPYSEIVSGLMYGGSYNELDGGQQKSVSDTQAAMTDGAIGLISMFYLASTPIESVGYNPQSQQFHAQVKLGNKTSFRIGSNMEGRSEVGLTKRLAGNWSFETFAISEDKDSASRGVAMLKWATRY